MAMSKKRLLAAVFISLFLVSMLFVLQGSLVSSALSSSSEATENVWTAKTPMPTPRDNLGAATVNGKIYAIGGSNAVPNSGPNLLNINEEYDPTTDNWTEKAPMPTARELFGIAVCQNKIYVFGGINGFLGVGSDYPGYALTGVNEVYDPSNDTWATVAPMPTVRAGLQANVVDGKIYLIGGYLPLSKPPWNYPASSINEVYDPSSNTWTTAAPAPIPIHSTSSGSGIDSHASAVVGSKIYVMGENVNEIYDTKTDTWTSGTPLPTAVYSPATAATTGTPKWIYVMGGAIGDRYGITLMQVYNPENNSWLTGADMPTARYYSAATVVNNTICVIGGRFASQNPYSFVRINVNEQYIPFGYGSVPTASPSPTLSASPTLSPSPTMEPSLEPTSTPQEQSGFLGTSLPIEYGYAIVAVLAIAVVAGLSLVYFKKRK
jgi:hypothetical protein